MADDREVLLLASTNIHGSTCTTSMGYTVDEWKELTEEDKNQMINETLANIVNIWTETADGDIID